VAKRKRRQNPYTQPAAFFLLPATKDIHAHPQLRYLLLSQAAWRFYTHRLTRAGRWFGSLAVLLLLASLATLDIQTYIPVLYVFAFWLVTFSSLWIFRPRVSVHAHHVDQITAGTLLPVEIDITQRGRTPGAELFVQAMSLPLEIDAVEEDGVPIGTLAPGETARVRLNLYCGKRGIYKLQAWRVGTDFPLGLMNTFRTFRQESALQVFPGFTPLTRMEVPTGRRYQPGGVTVASLSGDSFEYQGNREWREGDNIRDIDWRATARLGGTPLILREWREEYFLRVAVVLDTHIPANLPRDEKEDRRDDFERAVSLCTAVSDYMAKQDYIVDLFAAGPNLYHLTAGRSLAYLEQILDILSCVEESKEDPFATIEPQIGQNLEQLTTVVCVFLNWDKTRQNFVEMLKAGGVGVKVILVKDTPLATPPDGDTVRINAEAFDRGVHEM